MKVLLFLGAFIALAFALPVEEEDGKILTFTPPPPPPPPTTVAPVTTTRPCQTPAPVRIPCDPCVMTHCTPNMCNQAGNVYFPGDCTKFCQCESSGAIQHSCPPGLYFNPEAQVCDWPESSGCTYDNTFLPGCPKD